MRKSRGWLSFVNDIPLTWKFALIYLLCVLLPILSINVMFFRQVSENIQARETNNLQMTLDRAARSVSDLIVGGVTLSHSVGSDRALYEELDRHYPDLIAYYDRFTNVLSSKMKPFLTAYTYVENIYVYTDNDSIPSGGNYFVLDEVEKSKPWYAAATDSRSAVNLIVYEDVDPMNTSVKKTYFSIVRHLNEYPLYGHYRKYLKIDIKVASIEEILHQEERYMDLKVLDGQGRVLFPNFAVEAAPMTIHTDESEPTELTFVQSLGAANFLQGWTIVGVADEQQFQAAIQRAEKFIWELGTISTLVPTSLIFIILRSYNYRIKRLSRHMDKAKNEKFDQILLAEGKDEIGGLIRSFNRMTKKIESLINDVYKLEIQQKDMQLERVRAELKLLQSQVNPHFLFNTLNALLVVSAKNGYVEVTDPIKNLSQLLRRMLSWSEDKVPLQDELQFTEMYLKIEKFRFADRFDYSLQVDPKAKRCKIPKMCIQPLVENACKHGLQTVKGHRNIRVTACLEGSYLRIKVEDNGKGIDAERQAFIREQMNGRLDVDENVGLRNVYKRLQLHYGDRVDLDIDSSPDRGTRISFRLPADPKEGGQDHVLGATGG